MEVSTTFLNYGSENHVTSTTPALLCSTTQRFTIECARVLTQKQNENLKMPRITIIVLERWKKCTVVSLIKGTACLLKVVKWFAIVANVHMPGLSFVLQNVVASKHRRVLQIIGVYQHLHLRFDFSKYLYWSLATLNDWRSVPTD